MNGRSTIPLVVVGAALLVGWTLRLHDLNAQSFWYDEGTSATVAPRAVSTIVANAAADIHPPLYYLSLHAWAPLGGLTEFGLRFPSVLVGTLTLAFTYRLGRDALDAWTGAAAALLLACAPLPIWYSQEARMYAQATALGAASTALLVRALKRPSAGLWCVYAVALAAALYSHYFAATIPLAHGVGVGLWWLRDPTRRLRAVGGFLATAAAGALLFAPWVIRTMGQLTGWPATSQPFGLTDLVVRTFGLFTIGQGGDRAAPSTGLPLAAAVVAGVVVAWRAPSARWPLVAYALVPLAEMFVVSLRRPFFHPKFVLLVAPAVDLLAAAGIVGVGALVARRSRPLGAAAASLLLVALIGWRLPGVAAQWSDPHLARDDYRGLAADVARDAQPGDAVVLDAPGQVEIFDYYFRGSLPRYPLPESRPMDEAATGRSLEAIAVRHPRVWLVLWAVPESDPSGFVERWLDERMFKSSNRWYGGVRLALYVNPALSQLPTARFTPSARFGDVAELRSIELLLPQLRPGDVVPVTLAWSALRQPDRRYTVFVHVVDGRDYLWGQRDSEPVGGGRPTTSWRPGETVLDRQGVPILAGTPPGEYMLELGLYDGATGARLPVDDARGNRLGDRLLVGPLPVGPGRVGAEAKPAHVMAAQLGTAELLGYDLHPLGRDEAPAEVDRGQLALLVLYWRAGERPDPIPAQLAIQLGQGGRAAATRVVDFTLGRYPADRWSPGELIRDPYKLTSDDLAPGAYDLAIQLRPGGTGWTRLGTLVVR